MTAIIGQMLLCIACFTQAGQLFVPARFLKTGAFVCVLSLAAAFGLLLYAFAISDFSLHLVYTNSHTLKPLVYKLTAAWGNHEGSLLLAALILALYSLPVAWRACTPLYRATTRVLAGIGLLFGVYILITSDPFLRIEEPFPVDGRGFNPLLQDIGLAIHPPTLYVGYLGLAVPFALMLAGLKLQLLSRAWAEDIRRYTAFAWLWLTAGIFLGSHWAYRELGWGGFWFWDPVENASFMPWLAATALLHSSIVTRNRHVCYGWTAALAALTFFLVLCGFFLVRSGVITSVHAFASAPERGIFIIGALLLCAAVSVFALVYYPLRPKNDTPVQPLTLFSREGGILLQNIWMTAALATVMLGTVYPLVLEAISGDRVTVGAPYYNAVFMYFGAALFLMTALIAPLRRGERRGIIAILYTPAMPPFIVATLAGYGVCLFALSETPLAFRLLFPLVIGGFSAEIAGLIHDIRGKGVKRIPLPVFMMRGAHGGMWVAVAGILLASFLSQEKEAVVNPGDRIHLAGYVAVFDEMERIRGKNYLALRTVFSLYDGDILLGAVSPESRFYPVEQSQTAEAALHVLPGAHLYMSVGEALPTGEAGIRFMYRPGVPLLWAGGLILVLSGIGAATLRRRA